MRSKPNAEWGALPLTHISGGLGADSILENGKVIPKKCDVLGKDLAYTFYGRAGYRVGLAGTVHLEAYAPFCFIFDGKLLGRAHRAYPFDTGAYQARMYKPYIHDQISFDDFSVQANSKNLNKLVKTVFGSKESYFEADKRAISKSR